LRNFKLTVDVVPGCTVTAGVGQQIEALDVVIGVGGEGRRGKREQ